MIGPARRPPPPEIAAGADPDPGQVSAGLGLFLAGQAVTCRPSGALWIEARRMLVVADLHLEKGSFYAAGGQMLPPYDTADTLRRLAAEARDLAPRTMVLLGDSFHDHGGEARLSSADLHSLRLLGRDHVLVWVTGNHDPAAPRDLPGTSVAHLELGPLRLVHEPAPGPAPGEIAGHLHPCARVKARGGSVRRRCFVTHGERLVLPAFGALAGGLNVRDAAFSALFAPAARPLAAVLGAGRVHAVGWTSLRGDGPRR